MKVQIRSFPKPINLSATHKHFKVLTERSQPPQGTFEVDPSSMFDDQFNTTCGLRLHDWYENVQTGYGYYVENIDELNAFRLQFSKCSWCGFQEKHTKHEWCPKCRGSDYLAAHQYYLLAMRPLTTPRKTVSPPAEIIQSIEAAQIKTTKAQASKYFDDRMTDLNKKILNAEYERDFTEVAIARGVNWQTLQNVIYYSHTQTFTIGWRTSVTKNEGEAFLKLMEGWPVAYV
jgi:hypothetical protein